MSKTFRVDWAIDIDADTAEEAALKAQRIQRDVTSIATIFTVAGGNGISKTIDTLDIPRYQLTNRKVESNE